MRKCAYDEHDCDGPAECYFACEQHWAAEHSGFDIIGFAVFAVIPLALLLSVLS